MKLFLRFFKILVAFIKQHEVSLKPHPKELQQNHRLLSPLTPASASSVPSTTRALGSESWTWLSELRGRKDGEICWAAKMFKDLEIQS